MWINRQKFPAPFFQHSYVVLVDESFINFPGFSRFGAREKKTSRENHAIEVAQSGPKWPSSCALLAPTGVVGRNLQPFQRDSRFFFGKTAFFFPFIFLICFFLLWSKHFDSQKRTKKRSDFISGSIFRFCLLSKWEGVKILSLHPKCMWKATEMLRRKLWLRCAQWWNEWCLQHVFFRFSGWWFHLF